MFINYFYEWLEIAQEGSEKIETPNWDYIRKMTERSIPKIIYKHLGDVSQKQSIEVILQCNRRLNLKSLKCSLSSMKIRKSILQMKSFNPLRVSMLIFNNPSEENKSIRDYVDKYVRKLTI